MDLRKILKDILGLDALPKGEGLVGFTDEQLTSAITSLRDIAAYNKELRDRDALKATVDAFEAIKAEQELRVKNDEELSDLASRITVSEQDGEGDGDSGEGDSGDGDADAGSEEAPAEEAKVEAVAEPVKEPVMAAAPKPEPVIAPTPVVPEPTVSPTATPTEAPISLTAAGDVKGISAGQNMSTEIVASAMLDKANALARSQTQGRFPIGHVEWTYPTDRFLSDEDSAAVNTKKINAVVAAAQAQTREHLDRIMWERDPAKLEALVAEGGLCAPVNVRYEIFTVGTTARPLRDSLTRFGATRGGIRFNSPPTLQGDIAGSDAVNIYTEAQDASGSAYPKGCLTVGCGDDNEVTVDAITLCMIVGNYQRMFFGENFTAWWGLGRVQHARVAEDKIWDALDTLSTNVSAGEGLGATPDTLAQVERAAAQYRDRHRIDPETPLRLRAPAFLRNIMRVDLARRQPGDSTLSVSDGEIARHFAVRNIAVTWVLDGQIAGGTSGYNQAAGALNPWPSVVDVSLSIDGTFLFLDGGSLDFGMDIRDFTLIRTNDSAAFMETFENVAFVGPEALMLSLNICPDGTSAGTDDNFAPCTTGS